MGQSLKKKKKNTKTAINFGLSVFTGRSKTISMLNRPLALKGHVTNAFFKQ